MGRFYFIFFIEKETSFIQLTQMETTKLETLAALRAAQLVHEIGLPQSTFEGDLEVVINAFQQVDKHT